MIENVEFYIIALIIFLAVDGLWLSLIGKGIYQRNLTEILKEKPNFLSALFFYLIFILGLTVFVLTKYDTTQDIILYGSFYGFVCYATYDLTNLATIKKWPLKVTVIDLIWGSFLSGLTAYGTYFLMNL